MGRVLPLQELLPLRQRWREQGRSLVFTNGCFDLLHLGHVRYLQDAKALGDLLIVGLNSDASARRIKGEGRPILPQEERSQILAALACVDGVVIFGEETAELLVSLLQPEVYVKGGDYGAENLPEARIVAQYGGRTVILPFLKGHSTTAIIERILKHREGAAPS